MIWSIEFLEEAEKDMKKLDHSAQIQVLKGIKKVSRKVDMGNHSGQTFHVRCRKYGSSRFMSWFLPEKTGIVICERRSRFTWMESKRRFHYGSEKDRLLFKTTAQ